MAKQESGQLDTTFHLWFYRRV